MAVRNTCDGTGVEIPADTPTTGFYGKQYCPTARAVAEEYLAKVNAAHTAAAAVFQAALDAIRTEYRKRLQQLPDDPA